MKIYILGNGEMASAMAYGLKDKFDVVLVGRNKDKLIKFKEDGFETEIYGDKYNIENKNIILAFKPYALDEMCKILTGKSNICISVMARISFEELQNKISSEIYAICMPNIAARFKASTTPYFCDKNSHEIYEILSAFGEAIKIEKQSDMGVAGVISGCVPAFLAMVAESLGNGGVYCGLSKEISSHLTNSVFESTAKLLTSYHPANLKEKVCSPAGTTIKGVAELEKFGIRSAFINAILASVNKK